MFHKRFTVSYENIKRKNNECIFLLFLQSYKSFKIFPKSKKGNEKWTFLKMSKFWNPKKVSKNTVFSRCDQYALNYFFWVKKM